MFIGFYGEGVEMRVHPDYKNEQIEFSCEITMGPEMGVTLSLDDVRQLRQYLGRFLDVVDNAGAE